MRKHKFPDWFKQAWPDSRLDAMKADGDTLADATVSAIFAAGERELVNAILPVLHQPDQWPPATPPALRTYLASSQQLPAWADRASLTRAYQFMRLHGVRYNVVLLFLSLPILNSWQVGGAQTLALTGQLSQRFARRLSETLRFVRAVIKEQGMGPQGEGVRTTQKVRLMHATIRHFARGAGCPGGVAYWNPDWGQPINQEALTATMLAFSTLAVNGLRKLDVPVTPQDEADLLHLWKVIGHILGIRDENMPASTEEAQFLWKKCIDRNCGRSASGVMLAATHIQFMRDLVKGDPILTAALGDGDAALMRYLMGYRIAVRMLGIPRPGIWGLVVTLVRDLFGMTEMIVDMDQPLQKWLQENAANLLETLQEFWDTLDGSRPFHLPSEAEATGGLGRACMLTSGGSTA